MRIPAKIFPVAEDSIERAGLGGLLQREGSALLEGWSDDGPWRIVLPWAEEIRTAGWDDAGRWMELLREITDDDLQINGDPNATSFPFLGGWIGFVAYDAGASVHDIETYDDTPPEPPVWFARHERGVAIDPSGSCFLFCAPDRREETEVDLRAALDAPSKRKSESRISPIQHSLDANAYRLAVERIREAIRRGDLYQVNITRRLSVEGSLDPFALYLEITGEEPPRCSAYINGGTWQIASASPEVFLRYDARTGIAESRPIKGTVERTGDDERDSMRLRSSEKDASEHLMIVDLIRNDFGKVTPSGKVRVSSFRDVLALRHVLHLESTVRAEGLSARPFADVFASMFPSGSITGAPKRAVVQFIRELEPVPRGVYTGAIGFRDYRGRSEWSVAIRTAVITANHARYHAGGGVVWDSEPAAEERESIAKARAFLDYCRERGSSEIV